VPVSVYEPEKLDLSAADTVAAKQRKQERSKRTRLIAGNDYRISWKASNSRTKRSVSNVRDPSALAFEERNYISRRQGQFASAHSGGVEERSGDGRRNDRVRGFRASTKAFVVARMGVNCELRFLGQHPVTDLALISIEVVDPAPGFSDQHGSLFHEC
jgi:hypothetical protein